MEKESVEDCDQTNQSISDSTLKDGSHYEAKHSTLKTYGNYDTISRPENHNEVELIDTQSQKSINSNYTEHQFEGDKNNDKSTDNFIDELKENVEDNEEVKENEVIDIDEFLVRSGECSTYQIQLVIKMILMSFGLSFPTFIYYFISYDPPWINLVNSTYHTKEDDARCTLNRSDWIYDYDKTTLTTEYDLVCDKSWLLSLSGSVIFIGWGIGSFVLGYLSDIYGRKFIMLPCIFLDMFCLLLHAYITSIWWMIALRLVMGFFHAGPAMNGYILLVELIGPNYRVLASNIAGLIWGAGLCLLAIKAFLIDEWRTLCVVASAPYFGLICIGFWFPESVRWLNANGRTEEAEKILHKAAIVNGKSVGNVSIKPTRNEDSTAMSYIDIFNSWRVAKVTLSQGYIWLNNGMSYYTLSWAFADLGGGNMYINFALASIVELPMHAVAIICLEKFGRKSTSWCSQLVTLFSCLSVVFFILFDHFGAIKLLLGLVGKAAISLAFMCCYMWTSELFPTVVRTQGLGFSIIASRIGAAISPFANNLDLVHPTLPFLVMGVSSFFAFLLCFILPETLGKNTRETIEDMFDDD